MKDIETERLILREWQSLDEMPANDADSFVLRKAPCTETR